MSDTMAAVMRNPVGLMSHLEPVVDHGVSETAEALKTLRDQIQGRLLESSFLAGDLCIGLDELESIWAECSEPDWDGYGAKPVEPEAIDEAKRFLWSLPLGFPIPSASAEPDGDVELEWYRRPRWVFSVSIGRQVVLKYAGLFGRSEVYGTALFHDRIPYEILSNILRVYP